MEIDFRRYGFEDAVCLAGALALLAAVFLPWYSLGVGVVSGWDATRLSLVPFAAAVAAVLVVAATGLGFDFAEEYGVALTVVGSASLAVAIVRVFVRQVGLDPAYGLYVAIAGAAALAVAGVAKLVKTYVIMV